MSEATAYDIVGVGFGPGNLALAIALEESAPEVSARFVEAQRSPVWQGAMLLDGSDIQNHPSRDLVTLRNPRSRYTFLNYLFEEGRLVEHLNLPLHFPLRKEYAKYLEWATEQKREVVDLGERVVDVSIVGKPGDELYEIQTSSGRRLQGRALCLGTGRTPHVPPPFDRGRGPRVFHSSEYLPRLAALAEAPRRVAVIGGSQSAVEVTLDLTRRFPEAQIDLITRAPGLALKDTSPFSEEGYFPEFVDYYHRASRRSKRMLDDYMRRTNYSSVDEDVLHRLYVTIYEQGLDGRRRVSLESNRRVLELGQDEGTVRLTVEEIHLGTTEHVDVDLVVVATGYRDLGPEPHQERYPPLIEGVIDRFVMDDGYLRVNADYTLEPHDASTPPLVLNGLCESSHGIGDAGSFSLLSLRTQVIVEGLRSRGVFGDAGG